MHVGPAAPSSCLRQTCPFPCLRGAVTTRNGAHLPSLCVTGKKKFFSPLETVLLELQRRLRNIPRITSSIALQTGVPPPGQCTCPPRQASVLTALLEHTCELHGVGDGCVSQMSQPVLAPGLLVGRDLPLLLITSGLYCVSLEIL